VPSGACVTLPLALCTPAAILPSDFPHTPSLAPLTDLAPLTSSHPALYDFSSLLFGADLGFHEEWLRDEP